MKKIQLRKNYIEIPIVDDNDEVVETFKFYTTDENMMRMEKSSKKVIEMANDDKNFEDYEKNKSFIKEAVDLTFGEGSFDKLFELNPSLMVVSTYYFLMCEAIQEETKGDIDQQRLQKYMQG